MENSNNEQNNITETQSVEKKTVSDKIQYLIGGLTGLLTGATIYLTGLELDIQDQLISKLVDYAFLIVFVLFMVLSRKYENDHNVSLKKTKTAYMLAMGVAILIFLFMAITNQSAM